MYNTQHMKDMFGNEIHQFSDLNTFNTSMELNSILSTLTSTTLHCVLQRERLIFPTFRKKR